MRILGLPLDLYREASEHHDELRREFTLIAQGDPDSADVPAKLEELVENMTSRLGALIAEPSGELHRALARGDETIDLLYRLPRQTRDAVIELEAVLDEADEFCRRGDLLTLCTPLKVLAFRRWLLAEFRSQLDGAPPQPWSQAAPFSQSASR